MNNSKLYTEMFQDAESVVQLIGDICSANVTNTATGPLLEIQVSKKPDLSGTFLGDPSVTVEHEGNRYDDWVMKYYRFTERVIVWWADHDNV